MRPDMDDAPTSYAGSLAQRAVRKLRPMYHMGAVVGNWDIASLEPSQLLPLKGRPPSESPQESNPPVVRPLLDKAE